MKTRVERILQKMKSNNVKRNKVISVEEIKKFERENGIKLLGLIVSHSNEVVILKGSERFPFLSFHDIYIRVFINFQHFFCKY